MAKEIKLSTVGDDSMKVSVCCIVNINDKILLVKRIKDPCKDSVEFPGGLIADNELLKSGVIARVKEVAGFDIYPIAMLGVYDGLDRHPNERVISTVYLAQPEITDEQAKAIIEEQNKKLLEIPEDKREFSELKLQSLQDTLKEKFAYDHRRMFVSYLTILSLGRKIDMNVEKQN